MEKKEKVTPSRELTFKIEENTYTIKFPKTGEFISIEERKSRYGKDIVVSDNSSFYAKALINAIATFEILIPTLVKDLNIKDIFETDILFGKKLIQVYSKYYIPWYESWMNILSSIDEED